MEELFQNIYKVIFRIMQKQRLILLVLIGALVIGSVYLVLKNYSLSKKLVASQADAVSIHKNEKIISFTQLFVDKVLNADKEVDFETQLQLENAARDLKDNEVLALWQKFTNSKTETEAQAEVKNLLRLLISKTITK